MFRSYDYVGPAEIKHAAAGTQAGVAMLCVDDLGSWASAEDEWNGGLLVATFVVLPDCTLCLAPRRSEHVACAGGGPVLAAGELTIRLTPRPEITRVSNLSTGYCPEPSCWSAVRHCLTTLGIPGPSSLTSSHEFRRCPRCGERNLVKEGWFVCDMCGEDLPREWNFDAGADVR